LNTYPISYPLEIPLSSFHSKRRLLLWSYTGLSSLKSLVGNLSCRCVSYTLICLCVPSRSFADKSIVDDLSTDALYSSFRKRIMNRLHIVFMVSDKVHPITLGVDFLPPVVALTSLNPLPFTQNDGHTKYFREYPALVSRSYIDWYQPWPLESFLLIAKQ
jgi:hypothetical protein